MSSGEDLDCQSAFNVRRRTLPDGKREELPQRDEKVWTPLSVAIHSDGAKKLIAAADYQGWQRWVRSSATIKDDNQGLRFVPTKPTVTVYNEAGKIVERFAGKFNEKLWTNLAFAEDGGLRAGEIVVRLGAENGDARAGGDLVVRLGRRGYVGGRGVVAVAPEREDHGEVAEPVAGVGVVGWGDRGAWCGRCGGVFRGDEVVEEREVVVGVVQEGELVAADRGGGAGIGWSS